MTYTVDDIMALGTCEDYPRERVAKLWAGRDALSATEIAKLNIYPEDRLWALEALMDSDATRRLWACDVAEAALALVGDPDPRSVAAIEVARRYARGEATEYELAAAASAARAAAFHAAWSARSAAHDAAWDSIFASAVCVVDAGTYIKTDIALKAA